MPKETFLQNINEDNFNQMVMVCYSVNDNTHTGLVNISLYSNNFI